MFRSVWYFTSVDGTIKRKHKAKLDAEYILREFLKRPLACGIVAYYVQTSLDVDDAQRGLVETGLAPTTIEYLNEEQLRELLFNRQMNRGDGLLQKFLEPPDARNNMIRAQWSPKVCLIERRINRLNLNDTHYDMYERAVTFEGPDFHSEVTPVRGATLANKVDQIADAIIQHVAGVTNDRVKITRLALNFKVDYRDRLHFLFASSVRLQGSSRPLEVNTRLQVPEYIHRAQSVSRTAPAVLLRSLVCPTCQEKVHPEMVFEVVYRVIIEFEEQRRNAERQADSFQEQEEEEVPEAFLRLHPRLTVEEYVELRKELVFQQKFAGVCENCYLRFSTARLGAVQRLLAPELKGGDAAAEKQELGFLGTENAEAVQLVGTGQLDPQRLALRREATRQRILQRQGMEDSWWEAAEPETTNPPRSKSCPKLPSWSPNHKGAVLWAPSPVLAHRPRPPAAPAPSGTSLRQALADSPRPQRKPQVRLGAPYLKAIQDFAEQHRHRACEVLGPHAGAEIAALGGAQADIPQPEDLEDAEMERCEPSDKEMEENLRSRRRRKGSSLQLLPPAQQGWELFLDTGQATQWCLRTFVKTTLKTFHPNQLQRQGPPEGAEDSGKASELSRGNKVLHNVFSDEECDQLVAASEAMGYTEDAPVSLGRHIRQNENCVWIADTEMTEEAFQRCLAFLPNGTSKEKGPIGLNARWRFYKYNAGDIFRPHTDGSWPGSGIADGRLVHDMFGDRWSMLTWVLYLNDDFEGGGTRFMLPDGVFNQYTVHQVPATRGSVLCFYHGEHPLSPLHEGEMVTVGTKYIVRSDVLYKL
ncbi:unnamed protein product [Cladocopium goreaui]|uniref:Fe2OG dioxygenase domain-containing protein n=1 Tax=Cladocopium goreaui TaxID=2562237 RepID=A0A9P1BVF1_9DINO|nr:unnamed protein product [Cladocopium goreaui]